MYTQALNQKDEPRDIPLLEDAGAAALATARFFAEHNAAEAPGLELAVTEGAGAVADSAAVFAA